MYIQSLNQVVRRENELWYNEITTIVVIGMFRHNQKTRH
jgi:hypothetical protein